MTLKIRLLVVLGLLPIFAVQAETYTGQVVRVLDGDTAEVLDTSNTPHRVRLAGIDAPEKSQPFGTKAKQNLLSLVGGRQAWCGGIVSIPTNRTRPTAGCTRRPRTRRGPSAGDSGPIRYRWRLGTGGTVGTPHQTAPRARVGPVPSTSARRAGTIALPRSGRSSTIVRSDIYCGEPT